jgi:Transcription factor subunit Med10 of Mediator complex
MAPTPAAAPKIAAGARILQDKLHELLSRLAGTIEHVKNWPESTDSSIHVESTSRLIASIREIIVALQSVESTVKNDAELRQSLQTLLIPMDLLELLDHGLNPDCFSRGLLREAMGQLAGLKRRKLALEMLGAAVQKGLDKRLQQNDDSLKRDRSGAESEEGPQQPPTKKQKVDTASEPAAV